MLLHKIDKTAYPIIARARAPNYAEGLSRKTSYFRRGFSKNMKKPGESDIIGPAMNSSENNTIPNRAETLKVLRLMGDYAPMLMLRGSVDGYGARWTLDGGEIQPAIATYLMQAGFIEDSGATEMGARKLVLTEAGAQFRKDGLSWWAGLGLIQKLKIIILG
jgi:hypothetical protein